MILGYPGFSLIRPRPNLASVPFLLEYDHLLPDVHRLDWVLLSRYTA